MVDGLLAPVIADHMVGRGEHDARATLPARRLVRVVQADDVGAVHRFPVGLDRLAAQVDDAIGALEQPLHRGHVGQIGLDEGLAVVELGDLAAIAHDRSGRNAPTRCGLVIVPTPPAAPVITTFIPCPSVRVARRGSGARSF